MRDQIPVKEIAKALFTVNRHAKTAPSPQHLYYIKKETILRLLKEKRAKKIGLHFSNHPKKSNQHSTLLVQVDDYYFHIMPSKQDFKELKHLGSLDQNFRNPPTKMSLSQAKQIIYRYLDWKTKTKEKQLAHTKRQSSSYYTPSSLGQWPPKNSY